MKHSHLVRVTRLSHPKELEFSSAFGFRLSHPKELDFDFEFRLSHPKASEFSFD
jgi:hypothetical protein